MTKRKFHQSIDMFNHL